MIRIYYVIRGLWLRFAHFISAKSQRTAGNKKFIQRQYDPKGRALTTLTWGEIAKEIQSVQHRRPTLF